MKTLIKIFCLVSMIFLMACGENDHPTEETPVSITFAPSAMQGEEPYTLTVTVTGEGMKAISAETVFTGKHASITLDVPVGYDRKFTAVVKNGEVLYGGIATQDLIAEQPATVLIPLSKGSIVLPGHTSGILSVSYSPDGRFLTSGSYDTTVKIWNMNTFTEVKTLKVKRVDWGEQYVISVSYSPNGHYLAGGLRLPAEVKIWNVDTFKEVKTFTYEKSHEECVSCVYLRSVSFSPDGRFLASASNYYPSFTPNKSEVKIWDMNTFLEVKTLTHDGSITFGEGGLTSISFSPDGQLLASGDLYGLIRVWDMTTFKDVESLDSYPVTSLSYSPDGHFLAQGSEYGSVEVWDMTTFQMVGGAHGSYVGSVSYSLDGRFLASGSNDKTVKIWDTDTFKEIKTLRGHTDDVTSVSFSPDGRYLASGSRDETIRVWSSSLWQ